MTTFETKRIRPIGIIANGSSRPPRPRPGQHFLRGPIPLDWLSAAACLPGKSLHVGVAIWYQAGLTRSGRVPLSNSLGGRFGLDRNAKYRALILLEKAELISVERNLGRAPMVTIRSPSVAPSRGAIDGHG